MSNPPPPEPGSSDWADEQPGWQGQQPDWQPPRPGWQAQHPDFHGRREPDNYLVWAILCTVLCCLPFGIVSVVSAARVNSLWSDGRYDEAQKASKRAKRWAIAGAIIGSVIYAIATIAYVFLVVLAVKIQQQAPSITTSTTPTYSGTTSVLPTISDSVTTGVPTISEEPPTETP
ncbi:MAG: hypothetical protein QOH91_3667 [Mycobacterium sp.]|nr:hypothetical protein [Mycobacterium sp.]